MLVVENPLDCPECGHHFVVETYLAVDAHASSQETIQGLKNGLLNQIVCETCDFSASVDDLLLYHDRELEILLAIPAQQSLDAMPLSQGIASLKDHVPDADYLDKPLILTDRRSLPVLLLHIKRLVELERLETEQQFGQGSSADDRAELAQVVLIWSKACIVGKQYERAQRWLTVIEHFAKEWRDPLLEANMHHLFAELHAQTGVLLDAADRYQRAIGGYQALAQVTGGRISGQSALEQAMRCWNHLGLCHKFQGDLRAGLQDFRKALRLAEQLEDPYAIASIQGNIAEIYVDQGLWQQAMDAAQESLRMHEQLGATKAVAQDWMTLAKLHRRRGNFSDARDAYQRADEIFGAFEFEMGQAAVALGMGIICQQSGQLKVAEAYYQQAIALNQRTNNVDGLLSVLTTYAGLLSLMGETLSATEQYEQALVLSQTHGAVAHEMQARYGCGDMLRTAGRLREAEEMISKALDIARDYGYEVDSAKLKAILGGIAHDRGQYQRALTLFEEALRKFETYDDVLEQISQLHNIAVLLIDQADWSGAEVKLDQAARLADQMNHRQAVAHISRTQAVIAQHRRKLEEAETHYRKALEIDRDHHYMVDQIYDLGGIADVMVARGQYSDAIEYLEQAVALARKSRLPLAEAMQLGALGSVYTVLGNRDQAAYHYQQALDIYERADFVQGIAAQSGNLGWLHAGAGRLDEARSLLTKAVTLYEQINQPIQHAGTLSNLAYIEIASEQYDLAEARAHQAIRILEQTDDRYGKAQALSVQGTIQQRRGNWSDALYYQNTAFSVLDTMEAPRVRWRILSGRGSTYHLLGQHAKARRDFQQAVDEVERIRIGLKEEMHRIGFFGDDPLSIYTKIVFHFFETRNYGDALSYVERARSRAFVDRLGSRISLQPATYSEIQSILQDWNQ